MSYLSLLHVVWVNLRVNSKVGAEIEGYDHLLCRNRLNSFPHSKTSKMTLLGITRTVFWKSLVMSMHLVIVITAISTLLRRSHLVTFESSHDCRMHWIASVNRAELLG